MNRRVAINLGFFAVLFGVMLVWAVNNIVTIDRLEKPYRISGEFAATVGVTSGSEVAYLGVNYGRVTGVDSVAGGVVINMAIDRGKDIPAGSIARIFRKSAIGEPYVDFSPPADYHGDGGPFMQAGDVVPRANTTVPLEFSELLRSASALIGAVDPDQTRTLIHELALTLHGRSADLRALTTSSDALLQTFASHTDLLDRLSKNNTRLTATITEHRRALSSSIADLAQLAESLRRADGDTAVILDRGTQLLGVTADLVADTKQNLDCVLHDLDDVIRLAASDRQLQNLEYLLENAPTGLGYVYVSRDMEEDGVWVRVNLLTSTENPANQYIPPHELPAVPTVPPCVSTLSSLSASDGYRFTPGGGRSTIGSGATLPATGGQPWVVLALSLAFGGVAAWRARRVVGASAQSDPW